MEFRELRDGDIERLRARSKKEYDKLPDPRDVEDAIVGVDESGEPRVIMKAERVAELYMIMDHDWATPALRWSVIEQAHRVMRDRLKEKNYRTAYSFFADGVPNGYIRRLVKLGWNRMVERCIRFAEE